jgi:hypothetical protein
MNLLLLVTKNYFVAVHELPLFSDSSARFICNMLIIIMRFLEVELVN